MDRQWKWKVTGALLHTLLAVAMLVPTWAGVTGEGESKLPKWYTDLFSQKLVLGLDLQGGIHLQYKVDVPEALGRKAQNLAGNLEDALKAEAGVTAKATTPGGRSLDEATTIVVTFEKAEDAGKLDQAFMLKHAPDHVITSTEGAVVTLGMGSDALRSFQQLALDKAMETVERRINEFGVAESSVTRRGDSEIVVQIPGVKESEFAAAKEKLSQTGQLRFQIVDRAGWSDFFGKVSAREPDKNNWPADLKPELKEHVVSTIGGIRSTSREILEYMVKGQVDDEHIVGYQEYWTSP
jgi:preprotein translocase subunit SecD